MPFCFLNVGDRRLLHFCQHLSASLLTFSALFGAALHFAVVCVFVTFLAHRATRFRTRLAIVSENGPLRETIEAATSRESHNLDTFGA